MQYMLIIHADRHTEASKPPTRGVMERMGALISEIAAAGALVAADGLRPTAEGVRLRYAGGVRTITDGPFTEAKELIAGYTIVRASREQALAWGEAMLRAHVDEYSHEAGVLEVRAIYELCDFPADPFRTEAPCA